MTFTVFTKPWMTLSFIRRGGRHGEWALRSSWIWPYRRITFWRSLPLLIFAAEKIWIQTHFNHPREITPESARACRTLVNAGMPVSNHAVLLKGVND